MTLKERLLEFIKHANTSPGALEKLAGMSNGLINNLQESLSSKSIVRIKAKYPELNINWLLVEEGNMLIGKENTQLPPGVKELVEVIEMQNKILKAGFNLDDGLKKPSKNRALPHRKSSSFVDDSEQDIERPYNVKKKKSKDN